MSIPRSEPAKAYNYFLSTLEHTAHVIEKLPEESKIPIFEGYIKELILLLQKVSLLYMNRTPEGGEALCADLINRYKNGSFPTQEYIKNSQFFKNIENNFNTSIN